MLVDEVKIRVEAGKGGRGAVAFNKNMMHLGPTGGSGGKGASVYFEGVSDLGALSQFRFKKEIKAPNGADGRGAFMDGSDGKDIFLKVPKGTVVKIVESGKVFEITEEGQKEMAAEGGKGGKGNFLFRSSKHTTPKISQPGLPGESFTIQLELKFIADVGLVGLPNAGKSSLLNFLTAAKSRVENYPFTTLEPHLGDYYGLIIADIPGIIEDAHLGKGLGVKFLRHIERTKILFHLISVESEDPVKDYFVIRKELESHNPLFEKKKEFVFLSKVDMVKEKEVKEKIKKLKEAKIKVEKLSVLDDKSLEKVKKIMEKLTVKS